MMNFPAYSWIILLPMLISPIIYLAGRLFRLSGSWRIPYLIALLTLVAAWIPFVIAVIEFSHGNALEYTFGSISLHLDGLGLMLTAVTLGLGTFVVLYSGPYLSEENGQEKFYAMLVLMISMIIGLGCATDLFNLWIWFEAMAVSSYLLVAFYRERAASLEAGIKYLVQSAAGSVLIVVGIAMVLAATGSMKLVDIRVAAMPSPLLIAAGALFIIGFGVKAALVPLHTWLPDAHSQAPSGISAMLSGVVIEAGLIAMIRTIASLVDVSTAWPLLLIGIGIVNMLVGNLMALQQKQVKRLLAYSSVTQIGYMLLGLGITFYSGNTAGAQGGFFHLFNHALMKGLAFLSAGALLYTLHIRSGDHEPLLIKDLAGAARHYPLVALSLSLAVLGLGGLPPLAGFMSKWQIFVAGFHTNNLWVEIAVAVAALNSVLSLAYYAPLVNVMYRLEPSTRVKQGKGLPLVMVVPLVILALAVVVLGFWPSLMNWLTEPAGQALLASIGG